MGPERGDIYEGDELARLTHGLRLAVIALVSAAVTAGLVIGAGETLKPQANALLVQVADR